MNRFQIPFVVMACMVWLGITSCRQQALYEKLQNIPSMQWQQSYVPRYELDITDTTAYYKIYAVVRHNYAYPYRNIWLNVGVQTPGDSMRVQAFDLPLANAEKWLGTGMGDVYERRIQLFPQPVKFSKSGKVVFTLQQNMRLNPLPNVLQAGIRIEPVMATSR